MKKMSAKCNIRINKYNKLSSTIPKSSESFLWKEVNWKKIELRLNIFQKKIYAAKKNFLIAVQNVIVFLILLKEPCVVKVTCTVLGRVWRS